MRNKDLEARNNLGQGNRAIFFPFLNGLNVVDKNDEVVFFPVVVDSKLGDVAAGHDYLLIVSFWERLGRVVVFFVVFLVTTGLLLLIWVVVEVDRVSSVCGCLSLRRWFIKIPQTCRTFWGIGGRDQLRHSRYAMLRLSPFKAEIG